MLVGTNRRITNNLISKIRAEEKTVMEEKEGKKKPH